MSEMQTFFNLDDIDYERVVDYIMPKQYMHEISRIGYLHWCYDRIDNEYRLYHESIGLMMTIGEEYVKEIMEKTKSNSVNVVWALCGELMWRYFAENNGVPERCMLKRICNM